MKYEDIITLIKVYVLILYQNEYIFLRMYLMQ